MILTFDQLRAATAYERPADVERCLKQQGIRVFRGRDGVVWTTVDLVNAAGGIKPANDEYGADIV